MKRFSYLIVMGLIVMACSTANSEQVTNNEELPYQIPAPDYDSPEEPYKKFSPEGYRFVETAIGDSLSKAELIRIDSLEMSHLTHHEDDSIYLSYLAVGNYCGFFEGNYRFQSDTVFVWHREDAYDGCGENCLFRLDYVLPKPASAYTLWVNGSVVD